MMDKEIVLVKQSIQGLLQLSEADNRREVWFKKLKGTFLMVIGYLLSPLSWWNDLFFNMPIAYGFGYLCSLFNPNLLLPAAIAGYWFSNIAGILLMQMGAFSVFKDQSEEYNLKKELLTGILSSSAYTLIILALVQFKVLQLPELFSGDYLMNLGALFNGLIH